MEPKVYKVGTLRDIMNLPPDALERFAKELPLAQKVFESSGYVINFDKQIWVDDGKKDIVFKMNGKEIERKQF